MEDRVWEKVLDEIASWKQPVTVAVHGAGEPLLYGRLESVLQRMAGIEQVHGGFMTNAMLLDESRIGMILDSRMKWLALSIDGVDPATHDFFRVHSSLRRIEANVTRLIEAMRSRGMPAPSLQFNMVGYPLIMDQVPAYLLKWLPHASQITVATFRPIGSRHLWTDQPPSAFRPCRLLENQLVIGVGGEVGLCCEDIHLDVPLGNVQDQSLLEIFNHSPKLQSYRTAHQDGKIDRLTLCRDCHVWASDVNMGHRSFMLGDMAVEETLTPAYRLFKRKMHSPHPGDPL